jgi:hypothetical protein
MLKLPFKTQPKTFETVAIGNEEIGILELPKMADLSPNERLFLRDQMKGSDLRTEAVRVARAIADKSGMKVVQVYDALVSSDVEALDGYLEEFIKVQQFMELNGEKRQLALATAMLRRIAPDWTIEDTGNAEQIHPKLVALVAEFGNKEESGWTTQEPTPTTEEDLGKAQTTQTGEKSSGDAEDTGETIVDSTKKTSATSRRG